MNREESCTLSHRRRPRLSPKLAVPLETTQYFFQKFNSLDSLSNWKLYDSEGHNGEGIRTPTAIDVKEGSLAIGGDGNGRTGGMQLLGHPIVYGEVTVRAYCPPGAGAYHPVALLWGQGSGSSVDALTGELDFMEFWNDPSRTVNGFTLHYGDGSQMISKDINVRNSTYNDYSVRWTPAVISAAVNGYEYFRSTDSTKFPAVPMDLCLQLDWFPHEDTTRGGGVMYVESIEIKPL